MISPHGGRIVYRVAADADRQALLEQAAAMPGVTLNARELCDLEMLATGALSPLEGFMTRDEYESVLDGMHLPKGLPWSLPVTLAAKSAADAELRPGQQVALHDADGRTLGLLDLQEAYHVDKRREAQLVLLTDDAAHPGVQYLQGIGDVYLGGPITLLEHPHGDAFASYRLEPRETRVLFSLKGWRTVAAFQTRNPIHRAHEYLQKCAQEMVDGLLIHPLMGETKGDDIPAEVRMRCYEALLANYYQPTRVVLSVFPAAMRYAGPREAIFHALVRKNYGCTHMIVGRDHAGVGSYYGPYDAQRIFDDFDPQQIGITPLFFDHAFHCTQCGNMASIKTCPHGPESHVVLSGTKVREMLSRGECPPPEFTRPEVASVLLDWYTGQGVEGQQMPRVLVIGLDCATPQFVLGDALACLPNLRRLAERGLHGTLRSTDPPITVPAWTSMFTSYDPGMLGIYGFRNRRSYGYEDLSFANANSVTARTVWRHLSGRRLRSLVLGVPQTYPPKPLNGVMVSCFLTPDKSVTYTFPDEVKVELDAVADGDYVIDVRDFRTEDKGALLHAVYQMTERRFKAARYFLQRDSFDFAAMVEMGIDRLQHGFWRFCDPEHRLYQAGNPYESVIADYYRYIDEEVGRLLDVVGSDTTVLVVSDHGAQRMVGAICINEWLQREGYLVLREQPHSAMQLEPAMVDWSRTRAWSEGGYYARLFMNVEGREPEGIVPKADYDAQRDEIKARLEAITDEAGRCIGTRALKPEEIYRETRSIPPDLIAYLGDLRWRSAGSVGTGVVHLYENDTGPDDANHAMDGIFIAAGPGVPRDTAQNAYSIYDIAPTILGRFGIETPPDMVGRPIF